MKHFILIIFFVFMSIFNLFSKSSINDVKADFKLLKKTKHMYDWFGSDPYTEIVKEVQKILEEQVKGSKLTSFKVESDPAWLTGAIQDKDSQKATVTRAGSAFEFSLIVKESNGKVHSLKGVYSWVMWNMHDPKNKSSQVWFDIGGTLKEFGSKGKLKERVYLK